MTRGSDFFLITRLFQRRLKIRWRVNEPFYLPFFLLWKIPVYHLHCPYFFHFHRLKHTTLLPTTQVANTPTSCWTQVLEEYRKFCFYTFFMKFYLFLPFARKYVVKRLKVSEFLRKYHVDGLKEFQAHIFSVLRVWCGRLVQPALSNFGGKSGWAGRDPGHMIPN